ncbi:MAG: HYR domain-containing protein, partial [Flavobacteriales bacterium]|nr:HYR domain-containing protein [Flavobacteriales bacterium]
MKRLLPLLLLSTAFIVPSAFAGGGGPANDLCANAEPIVCGQTISSSSVGSSAADAPADCGTSLSGLEGVWYTFTGDGSTVTASTCSQAGYDTKLGIFSGSCGSLVCVDGNDDFVGCTGFTSEVEFATLNGTQYYIYVTGFLGATGSFDLTLNCVAPPPPAGCVGSLVDCGDVVGGSTVGQIVYTDAGTCTTDLTQAGGVWHKFVGNGSDVTFSLCGSGFDTKMGVFSGSCGSLICELGNDDFCSAQSEVTIPSTTIGDTLYIYVTGWNGAEGAYTLSVSCSAEALCQDITVQLDGTGSYEFDTPLTPQTDAEAVLADGSTTNTSFWQSFTPTVSGVLDNIAVTFALLNGPNELTLNVYDGQGVGGTLLHTQAVSTPGIGTPEVLDIPTTLDLTASTEYTFEIIDVTGSFALQRNSGNPYAGGISSIGAGTDLRFSVDLLQRPLVDNGSSAASGLLSFGLSQTEFDCADIGDVPVTMTYTDKNGLTIGCSATVTVEDNEDPVAACIPWTAATQVVNNYGISPNTAIPDGDPGGMTSVLNVPDSFNPSDLNVNLTIDHTWVGDLIITLTHDGNTAILVDRMGAPAIGSLGCSDDNLVVTVDDAAGSAFEDACTGTGGPVVGTFTGVDLLSVFNSSDVNGDWTLFVSDNAGADTGTLIEWSIDATEDIPASYTQFALDGTGNYTVDPLNDIDDGSSDNCSVTLTTNPASFSCADVGVQSIILTATDPAGNAANCTTSVEVIDNLPPTAACQDITVALDGSGAASIVPGDIDNGSADNCGIATMSLDILDFNCSNLGGNTVTLTVEDVNGNTATCDATVTIEDNQDPVITCPSDIVVCSVDANGSTVSYTAPTGSDNCGFVISQTDPSGLTNGDVFPIGVTTQEWTIVDEANNTVTCTFTVTVNATPDADYEFTPACQGESIFFTDLSTIEPGYSIVGWSWDMDDGSAVIGIVDPIHQYADTGLYVVQL